MSESEAVAVITSVCEKESLQNYKIVRLQAQALSPIAYEVRFALIAKEGLSESFIKAMILRLLDEGEQMRFEETTKRIDDLDTEIMMIRANITL